MKKSVELKQDRAAKVAEQQRIVDAAKAENRELTDAEGVQFDALTEEIRAFKAKIERAEQIEANELLLAGGTATPVAGAPASRSEENEMNRIMRGYSLHKALRSHVQKVPLTGVEAEMNQEMTKRAQESGVAISGIAVPSHFPAATRADGQTVTQDSGDYGANLVATDLQAPIEFLRPQPVLRALGAQYFSNLRGNVAFPVNEGGISAAWAGEITPTTFSKNKYGIKEMKPNRLVSMVAVSLQNLLQSNIDLERYTIDEINAVVANALDIAGLNGSGTGQPLGLLNAVGTNAIVGGVNGAAPSWKAIVDMETAVYIENANKAKMNYLINPGTRGFLKTTKHQAGDLNYLMGIDNSLNGYDVTTSNLVPANLVKGTADPVSAAIFGDFSQLLIGQWGFYDLDTKKDAQAGNIEITVNSFFDVLVRQPKAFSIVKDWDLS